MGIVTEVLAPAASLASYFELSSGGQSDARPDAVIIDTDTLLEELGEMANGSLAPDLPPIVLLGTLNPSAHPPAEAAISAIAVVSKPVRRAELRAALGRALNGDALPEALKSASREDRRLRAHVLVAEDNPVNQTVAEGFLVEMGCTVTCVGNGRGAITCAGSGAFDLILMDLQMPDIDGIAATTQIRAAEAAVGGRRTPIIAVTANATPAHRDACLAAGMDDFLGKPLYFDDLLAVLKRWMPEHVLAGHSPATHESMPPTEASRQTLDLAMIAGIRSISRSGQACLFARLVQLFSANSRHQMDELRRAIGRGDLHAAATVCHSLKGSAGNVGAAAFSAVADALKLACDARDRPAIERLARDLERLYPTALAALDSEAIKESA